MRPAQSAYPTLGVAHAAILAVLGRAYRDRPLEPREIARIMGLPLKRTLPALGALAKAGLLETRGRRWRLTPTGQAFVDDNSPEARNDGAATPQHPGGGE